MPHSRPSPRAIKAEEQLRLLREVVREYAFITFDRENLITSWSGGAEEIFLWNESEILGRSGLVLFTPEDRERQDPEKELATALSKGCAEDERWHLRKDGSRFWASGVLTAVRKPSGEIAGFIKVLRDLTERKQAEEALRQTQERTRSILHNLPGAAVFLVDRDLRYEMVGGEALLLAGFDPQEFIGRRPDELRSPGMTGSDLMAEYAEHYRRALAGTPFEAEHHIGGGIYVTRGVPLRDSSGEVTAVLAASYDMTHRRRAESVIAASEARHAFLLRLTDALASLEAPGEIQNTACRLLGEHLQTSRVCYAVVDGQDLVVTGGWYDSTPAAQRKPITSFGATFVELHRRGETIAVNNVAEDPRLTESEKAGLLDSDIQSYVGVILQKSGTWVAAFGIHHRHPRDWTSDELHLIREVAGRVWSAVESARAAVALQESEELFRLLVENVQEYALFQTDPEGCVTSWNTGAERLFGYTETEMLGQPWGKLLVPDDQARGVVERELEAIAAGERLRESRCMVRSDGKRFWVHAVTEPVCDESGKLRGLAKVLRDETERRRAEYERDRLQQLERSLLERKLQSAGEELDRTKEELRALAAQLLTVQEDERRRVARELHDDLGQRMAVLELGLKHLAESIDSPVDARLNDIMRLRAQVGPLVEDIRQLSYRLHPDTLEHLGLRIAVGRLVEDFASRWPVAVDYAAHGLPERIPMPVATAIYRIVQESLRNISKFASGSHVAVLLSATDGMLELTIEDSGPGFDQNSARRKGGLGLVSMGERTRLLGGTIAIDSENSRGTTITVRVPLEAI